MNEITIDAKARMNKSVDSLRSTLSTLRTGRANAQMLSAIMVYLGLIYLHFTHLIKFILS